MSEANEANAPTADEIAEHKALCEKATPGKWFCTTDGASSLKVCTNDWKEHSDEHGEWICSGSYDYETGWAKDESANFCFIAQARSLLPRYISAYEAQQARLKAAEAVCEALVIERSGYDMAFDSEVEVFHEKAADETDARLARWRKTHSPDGEKPLKGVIE